MWVLGLLGAKLHGALISAIPCGIAYTVERFIPHGCGRGQLTVDKEGNWARSEEQAD
ncbi:hypothetical protein [Metallosphaera yellowstonensis]|uniref:hypothetical protein n=1 Tax=Metallosphaera yellowstonensis TaxID=1111107 RepID=UPI000A64B9E4|nr:hypothetical protein [Metallosphaera yellowstonensis]